MKHRSIFFLSLILFVCTLTTAREVRVMTLVEAFNNPTLVDVQVLANQTASSGRVTNVVIKALGADIKVHVEAGTVFTGNADMQDMATAGTDQAVVVKRGSSVTVAVDAFCTDFGRKQPRKGATFSDVTVAVNALHTQVLVLAKKKGLRIKATQAALWKLDGVPDQEIKQRYPISQEELDSAGVIVKVATAQHEAASTGVEVKVDVEDLLSRVVTRLKESPFGKLATFTQATSAKAGLGILFPRRAERETATFEAGDEVRVVSIIEMNRAGVDSVRVRTRNTDGSVSAGYVPLQNLTILSAVAQTADPE